ncbi:acetylcholine receptor subunit alpha-1-B-like [Liolophura sinensis]|uniref:acetylcholine receptor subunit alpha-1-B-like n=1 Tax=Liolophura sinensis TaxID=3198878 RepID=UPI003158F64E
MATGLTDERSNVTMKQTFSCTVFLLKVLTATVVTPVFSYTAWDEKNLRTKLLTNYNTKILPGWNQSETFFIHMGFALHTILDLDEKHQVLKLSGNLQLKWENHMLRWNPSDYGGIKAIQFNPHQQWTPKLAVGNSVNSDAVIGSGDYLVRVFYDGTTLWYPTVVTKTKCTIRVTQYPFDTHTCPVTWNAQMYTTQRMFLNASRANLALHLFHENGEWELTYHRVHNEEGFHSDGVLFSKVVCELTLKRRAEYHVINTVLPVLMLSLLNAVVFLLPPESGEKMSLSITVLLAYALFLSAYGETMPSTSNSVSALAVYMVFTLGLGTMSTFLSAIVLNYAYDDENSSGRFFSPGCFRADQVSHGKQQSLHASGNEIQETALCEEPSVNTRRDNPLSLNFVRNRALVKRIDIACFWIFLGLVILLAVVCIVIMIESDVERG